MGVDQTAEKKVTGELWRDGTCAPFRNLDGVFAPRSVAVVGASGDPDKFGGRALDYLLNAGYGGSVYPVNSRQSRVMGANTWPDLASIGRPIDAAVIAVPPPACIEAIEQCAALGVKAAIVFTSGFAEAGEAGRAYQQALADAANAGGVRILGPNCIGIVNERLRFAATFATMWREGWGNPGPVSFVSQSGAMASYLYVLLREGGIGTANWCATGNEADVDAAECIAHLVRDDETRVIVAALEGVKDGRRLIAALELAREAKKPVVVLKMGKSRVGADAVRSHTGALAGEDRVFDAAVRQSGALRCSSFEEAIDLATVCALGKFPSGRRLGIVTASGGAGIMIADRAEELGIEVPALPASLREELDRIIPGGVSRNPVDVTAMVLNDFDLMINPIRLVAESPGVDAVIAFLTSAFRSDAMVARLAEAIQRTGLSQVSKPVMLSLFASPQNLQRLHRAGLPAFVDPLRAVKALDSLLRIAAAWRKDREITPQFAPLAPPPPATDESGLLAFFAANGIPVVASRLAHSASEAAALAEEMGLPVAMKISIPGLAHKSELGGIRTGIATLEQAKQTYTELHALGKSAPGAGRLEGITVQKMASGVVEMMMGFRRDPLFGPVVVLGFGGKWVEVIDDVVMRVAPFGRDTAMEMIESLRGRPLLEGARGSPRADIGALAEALARFSVVAARLDGVASAEINPFILEREGAGGFAADCKLVSAAESAH